MLIRFAFAALIVVFSAPAAAVSLVPTCIAGSGSIAVAGGGSDSGTGCGTMASFFVTGVDAQVRAVDPPVTVEGASIRLQALSFAPFGTMSGTVSGTFSFDVPTLAAGESLIISFDAGGTPGILGLSASVNGSGIDLSTLVQNGPSLDVPVALAAGTHTLALGLTGSSDPAVAPGGLIIAALNLGANVQIVSVPEAGTALLLAFVLIGLRRPTTRRR